MPVDVLNADVVDRRSIAKMDVQVWDVVADLQLYGLARDGVNEQWCAREGVPAEAIAVLHDAPPQREDVRRLIENVRTNGFVQRTDVQREYSYRSGIPVSRCQRHGCPINDVLAASRRIGRIDEVQWTPRIDEPGSYNRHW